MHFQPLHVVFRFWYVPGGKHIHVPGGRKPRKAASKGIARDPVQEICQMVRTLRMTRCGCHPIIVILIKAFKFKWNIG